MPQRPREPVVLPVRAVARAVGEQHDVRVRRIGRRLRHRGEQRLAQEVEHAVHRLDAGQHLLGERGRERRARGHGEGDPARRAQVVLEHRERAVVAAHDVEARDPDEAPPGRAQAGQLGLVVLRPAEDPAGHHPVGDDPLRAVHVGHEGVERADALLEPAAEPRPLVRVDHARHRVDDELAPPALGVERHPGRARLLVHERPQRAQVVRADGLERGAGDGADLAAGIEGLVPRRGRVGGRRGGRHLR